MGVFDSYPNNKTQYITNCKKGVPRTKILLTTLLKAISHSKEEQDDDTADIKVFGKIRL